MWGRERERDGKGYGRTREEGEWKKSIREEGVGVREGGVGKKERERERREIEGMVQD